MNSNCNGTLMKQIISGQQFKANPSNGVSTVIRLPLDKKRNGRSQRPVINNAYMQREDLTGARLNSARRSIGVENC